MRGYRMMLSAPQTIFCGSALTIGEDKVLRICRAGEKHGATAGEDLTGEVMVEVDDCGVARPVLARMIDPVSEIDYRDLLIRYMEHVGQCEGIDFTDRLNIEPGNDIRFTYEEVVLLQSLSKPQFD